MNTMWWFYFVILLGSILALLYKYFTRNYDYWKKRNVYFVKPYPFFGSILPVFALQMHISEWLKNYCDKIKDDYFGIFILNRPMLVVKSPKLIRAILQKDFTYFDDRSTTTSPDDPYMAEFIFFKKNPEWKLMRSKLSPNFTPGKIKLMFPLMLEESNEMIDYLRKLANVSNVDSRDIAAKYTTNVLAKCAFAVNAGSFRDENAEFRKITKDMSDFKLNMALRQLACFLTPDLVKIFKMHFFPSKVVNPFKRIILEVLNLKKQIGNTKRGDLIDMMLDANKTHGEQYFTDDAIVGNAIMFLVAGYETSSSTISFTLYELAMQPELQERLRNEILDTIQKENGVTYSAIQDMKYLDMVVCETLRKYTSPPLIDRICKADYKIEGSDFVIEKGMSVFISQFGMHHNPEYFPDPQKFDPERFADKSKINNDGIFYIPFGDGPRICIGERFALLSVKVAITQIMLKFRVERSSKTPDRIKFEPKCLSLQSKDGIPLTFVPLYM